MECPAEQRRGRLEGELGVELLEALDVRRIRDDEVPALGGRVDAAPPERYVEAESLRILARERERVG